MCLRATRTRAIRVTQGFGALTCHQHVRHSRDTRELVILRATHTDAIVGISGPSPSLVILSALERHPLSGTGNCLEHVWLF